MNTKTQVTEIRPGDVIDFDAHRGCTAFYTDKPKSTTWSDWFRDSTARAAGQQTVTRIERVSTPVTSGGKKTATALLLTFTNGRSIEARGTSKFPVQS